MRFADTLNLKKGITAFVGSGGKSSLIAVLAAELREEHSVIVTTTTHIYPLKPFAERVSAPVHGMLCVGTLCESGKLAAPQQSFAALSLLAEYILVEADGSKHFPLKAHAPYEPVIPPEAVGVITVVGASGLNRPVAEAVHRPQHFTALCGGQTLATPQAVAGVLQAEGFAEVVVINQCDNPASCAAARELASYLPGRCCLASVQGGTIECLS